jgi:hypothetical protein
MGRVFVVQEPTRWDNEKKAIVPKFNPSDLAKAEQFGKIEYLLSPRAAPFNSAPIIRELSEKLDGFGPEDYLLCTGNPILIGLASAIAADASEDGSVRFLQWSGKDQAYIPINAQVFE